MPRLVSRSHVALNRVYKSGGWRHRTPKRFARNAFSFQFERPNAPSAPLHFASRSPSFRAKRFGVRQRKLPL
jgi:hypothetical protein